ncbi:NACHT, LRR and PYD domains-containing protein 3-like isoform X1 [Vanacampus margaritifer]
MARNAESKELLRETLIELGQVSFKSFKFYTRLPTSVHENADVEDIVKELLKRYSENALEETAEILDKIKECNLAQTLRNDIARIKARERGKSNAEGRRREACGLNRESSIFSADNVQITKLKWELQENLRFNYFNAPEGVTELSRQPCLEDVYTDIHITHGSDAIPNKQHEVLQMEMCGFAKKSIEPCDLFKSASGKPQPIRMLLTIGFAGIGKTFLVRKFVLDWASQKKNKDVDFIFPFTFRELNFEEGKTFSLAKLIRHSIWETKAMSEEMLDNIFVKLQESGKLDYESSSIKILFVLDGLDECRLKLDLTNKKKVDLDVTKAYPVEVLLSHLIKKNLLPCARVWITTRPATAHDIPPDLINSITEVQGFSDSQRLDYFRKRFKDEEYIIKHIQKSRTIFIMCHLPIFCWLTSTVLQDYLDTGKEGELPQTLTELYTEFLLFHLDKSQERETKESIKYVKALAKLAFDHLLKKSHIFSETDLQKSGFDYFGAAKHSGMFTEVFKEVQPLKKNRKCKMFQFIHLTIQEYLAALYVMMSLFHDKKNVLANSERSLKSLFMTKKKLIVQVHKTAIHKASKSDGNLDLFLRFLLGLSLQSNQDLLGELLKAPKDSGRSNSETVLLIRKRMEQNSPEKNINLFYCLKEMKDDSLLETIQIYLNSGPFFMESLSPAMWSALVFFLLTSDEAMNCFDLQRYSASVEGFTMLLPVIKASQKSLLINCELDKKSCEMLASVLSSPSNLRDLDLSDNDLYDDGVEILSAGLAKPHCILQVLRLKNCKLGKKSCEMLASVLSSPSNLRDLDLSDNDLYDDGVEILSAGLAKPHCILQVLRLSGCMITTPGCVSLAKALKLNPSHLQVLDLSYNNPGEEGKRALTEVQMDPSTSLKTLNLDCSGIERLIPGPKKYFCSPTLDPNTAHNFLQLSDHCKTVTVVLEEQQYPLNPQMFTCWRQVLCKNGLSGRCYWEVYLEGEVEIAVTYDSIRRIGFGDDAYLGFSEASWVLLCYESGTFSALHQNSFTNIKVRSSRASRRVGVFLDHPRGKLSFYKVTSEEMILLHSYYSTFTKPLYPAFGFPSDHTYHNLGHSVSISVASEPTFTHPPLR